MKTKQAEDETMVTLAQRARDGERKAFTALVEAHVDRVHSYLFHMVGNREEAEDLAQETFVRAWQNIGKFRGGAAFSTWLYRIATNLAIDAIRRRTRRGVPESLDAPIETANGGIGRQVADELPGPEDVAARTELQTAVRKAVNELSPKLRTVLVLYDFEQLTYDQIATVLRLPLGTVKSRLFHARQQLKAKLARRLPIEDYVGRLD